jgi:hypothetical protein
MITSENGNGKGCLVPRPDLAELARRINSEHAQAEGALRAGLQHARTAGQLLLEAKAKLAHGQWLPWLKANIGASKRTCQGYMRVCEQWPVLEAKAQRVALLSYREALAVLAEPTRDDEDDVPAALAFYRREGALDEASLGHILELADDYGPEVVTELCVDPEGDAAGPATQEDAFGLLNSIRPLDMPTLWPIHVEADKPGAALVIRGVDVFRRDVQRRGGRLPHWEVAAFWWACQAVLLGRHLPEHKLRRHLETWRESFRTAIAWMLTDGLSKSKDLKPPRWQDDPERAELWWGYCSDLRHAGVLEAVKAIHNNPDAFPGIDASCDAGLRDMADDFEKGYPVPTCMQPGRGKSVLSVPA